MTYNLQFVKRPTVVTSCVKKKAFFGQEGGTGEQEETGKCEVIKAAHSLPMGDLY